MKCQKCGAKWTTKSSRDKEICPFCGENLVRDTPYKQAVDVLGMIIDRFGIEIYSDERKLFGLINDLLLNISKEKNILKTAISLGVSQLIMSIKRNSYDRKDSLEKGYELLDNGGMSSYWCAASLYILAAPLNIDTIDIYPLDDGDSSINFDNKNILYSYSSITPVYNFLTLLKPDKI